MYKVVQGSRGERRSFAITCGLAEGYGPETKTHSGEEAVEVILGWQKHNAAAGQAFLTGTVSTGEVVYAWQESLGVAGGGHEPAAIFSGEVSPLYNADTTDENVEFMLEELAGRLGNALGQTRVYVAYGDKIWILQREATFTPRGETV